ncbi:MAG: tetratricopeptide repeat protein [Phycisphaerales bacterium]|nr:tetratricopeptide repeat protein [Phycisphaerales bacterium]
MKILTSIAPSAFMIVVSSTIVSGGSGSPSLKRENPNEYFTLQVAEQAKPSEALKRRIREHLRAGRINEALRAAQESLAKFPQNTEIRQEFVALHISLARGMIAEENFTAAERALLSVLKVDDDQKEARRLIGTIESARKEVPHRVEEAKRWITLEWFEPAFNTLRQAGALRPAESHIWALPYQEASIGAGDDHYFTKNFHEAFYYYDAAIKLGEELGKKPSPSLSSRWMQSMVHALADDIDRTRYPPAYWKLALQRAGDANFKKDDGLVLIAMLRGLAYENMGLPSKAASEYGRVLGRPLVSFDADLVAKSRQAAIRSLRGRYSLRLSKRRKGIWSENESGDWQVFEARGFRIHHRNFEVAQHVAKALEFHFARIADLMALDSHEVPWPISCDVHLYADGVEFRKATGQPEHVQAISIIRKQGQRLQSHAIHSMQTDPLLLSASLPHELSHLMVGAVTDYRPFKAVMNEGLALHVEPPCRQRQFARLFADLAKPRSVVKLLEISEVHPPTPDFYAEAYRLMAVLIERSDISTALEAGTQEMDRRKLARLFGFNTGSALEQAYRGPRE